MASAAEIGKKVQKFSIDNSPFILTAIGTAGIVTTAVLSAKGGIKASRILENERYNRSVNRTATDEVPSVFTLTFKQQLAMTWRCYIPACGVGVLTISAVLGANQIGTRRAAAMATAFSISEKAFTEYRDKVVEKIGENKERQVVDDVAQDRVTRDFPNAEVIIMGGGDQMCYDSYSGRFFKSDMEALKHSVNRLNHKIVNDNYASLTDFYNFLGLERTAVSDDIGWNCDKLLDIHFTTTLTPDGKPAIAMEYRVEPIRDYFRLH